jgi:hypothetical protein
MAESEIAKALDPLQPDDAMAALIEIQPSSSPIRGSCREHPNSSVLQPPISQLAERIHNMRQGVIAGAH